MITNWLYPKKQLALENDACQHGLGVALMQHTRPAAFASHLFSEIEQQYTQIDKEILSVTNRLEITLIEEKCCDMTDHEHLVAICMKPL